MKVKCIKDGHVTRNDNFNMVAVESPIEKMIDRELTP